jgi:hypothetical protein
VKKRVIWVTAATIVALGALLFWPFESTVCEELDVLLTDKDGQPVRGAAVTQSWTWYVADGYISWQTCTTDANGHAAFSKKVGRASLASRIAHEVRWVLWPIHMSHGVDESFGVRPTGETVSVFFWRTDEAVAEGLATRKLKLTLK